MNEENFNYHHFNYYYNNVNNTNYTHFNENLANNFFEFNNQPQQHQQQYQYQPQEQQFINFDVYNQLDDHSYTDAQLNYNSLLLNKNTWSPSDYAAVPTADSILTHENINLLRNIENLKRLWQTNEISNGHIEAINRNNELNARSNKNAKRTFADVAKTTAALIKQQQQPSFNSSASSTSSSSSSSSASISPPIYKIQMNSSKPANQNNNNTKKHRQLTRTIETAVGLQQCRPSTTTTASILQPSNSLESVKDCADKVEKFNSKPTPTTTNKQEIVKSNQNENDSSSDSANSINISLSDIKPDSKYGLDSFDFPEKAKEAAVRKRNKNNAKRKSSLEIINAKKSSILKNSDDNISLKTDSSEYDTTEKPSKTKRKQVNNNENGSLKLNKKSKAGCLNQRKDDATAAKLPAFKTNGLTCYDDISECLKEFFCWFSSSIKSFFGFILIAFVILYGSIIDCVLKLMQAIKNYFVEKYAVINYFLKSYVYKWLGFYKNEKTYSSLCHKVPDTLFRRILMKFKTPQSSSHASFSDEMNSVNQILQKIDEKVNKAKNIFYCEHCSCLHKLVDSDKSVDSARYCSKCRIHHQVEENDLWCERIGFWSKRKVEYYACLDRKVYDVTEIIECRLNEVDQVMPNDHKVFAKLKRSSCGHGLNCNPVDTEITDELNEQVYSFTIQHVDCSNGEQSRRDSSSDESQQNGSAKLIPNEKKRSRKC